MPNSRTDSLAGLAERLGAIQYDADGRLQHLLTLEGLRRDTLEELFSLADSLVEVGARSVKNVPLLHGKTVVLLFFEASTRTRTTFEIAAKRLSADVVTLDVPASSASKGESLRDTVLTVCAMGVDGLVTDRPGREEGVERPVVHAEGLGELALPAAAAAPAAVPAWVS